MAWVFPGNQTKLFPSEGRGERFPLLPAQGVSFILNISARTPVRILVIHPSADPDSPALPVLMRPRGTRGSLRSRRRASLN